MKKVKIVRGENPQELENKINKLLAENWEINGSIALDNDNYLYLIMLKLAAPC